MTARGCKARPPFAGRAVWPALQPAGGQPGPSLGTWAPALRPPRFILLGPAALTQPGELGRVVDISVSRGP